MMGVLCALLGCSRTVIVMSPHSDGEGTAIEHVVEVEAGSAETIEVDCSAPDLAQKVEISWASGKKVTVRYWCAVNAPPVGGLEASDPSMDVREMVGGEPNSDPVDEQP